MTDTIDRVCRGRAPLKGSGTEVFHFAVGHKTLCNRNWYEAGWLKMDTDVDVETAKQSIDCCKRCAASDRIN